MGELVADDNFLALDSPSALIKTWVLSEVISAPIWSHAEWYHEEVDNYDDNFDPRQPSLRKLVIGMSVR